MVAAFGYLIIYLLIIGMAAGWLAWVTLGKSKTLKRADRRPNWAAILGLGVAGSFVGGLGANLLLGYGWDVRAAGLFASFIGSLLTVGIYSAMRNRSK